MEVGGFILRQVVGIVLCEVPFAGWAGIHTYTDLTGSLCWVLLPLAAWHCTPDLGLCPWFGACIAQALPNT